MLRTLRAHLLAFCLPVLVAGCGSGFVAIFSNDGSGTSGPSTLPSPPALATNGSAAPLLPQPNLIMQVVVQNYELPANLSRIRVELRAFEDVVDTQFLLRLPNSNTVDFFYSSSAIQAKAKELWGPSALEDYNVPASLAVLVDGLEVAPAIPLTLLHQPHSRVDSSKEREVLSPLGQSLRARVTSISLQLPDTSDPPGTVGYTRDVISLNDLRARVAFGPNLSNEQVAVITRAEPGPGKDELLLTLAMPDVEEPIQAHFLVDSRPSGRSTLVSNVFYRPDLFGTSPATGASEGGTTVVLFGKALVPRLSSNPNLLDFDRLRLTVRKGGRETEIPTNRIRKEVSNSNRLEFPMPPAPDGRSGPVDIVLGVTVDSRFPSGVVLVESRVSAVFTYGDTYPYFGPRGAQMRARPAVVRYSPFIDTTRPAVDALSVESGPAGMPYASVLTGRGNGLFTRFGQPVQAGVSSDAFQRYPIDFCLADFVGDGTRAGVIINRGFGEIARHSMVLGSSASNPPLSFNENLQLSLEESGRACRSGDFNRDETADLIVLGSPLSSTNSSDPILFLSSGTPGNPRFNRLKFSTYPGPFSFTAVDVADVDGDGLLDLVFASGGLAPRLLVAFGDGQGAFLERDIVDLTGGTFDLGSAGYTPAAGSIAVGVHVLGQPMDRSIALVLSGVSSSMTSPPAVINVRLGSVRRTFAVVKPSDILAFPGKWIFAHSDAGELSNKGIMELAVAASGDDDEPIRIFARGAGSTLTKVDGAVPLIIDGLTNVSGVGIGVATSPNTHNQTEQRPALFVTHVNQLAGGAEHRVSTFLRDPSQTAPKLLSPHAARALTEPILGLTLGEFFPKLDPWNEKALDAWLLTKDGLVSYRNDGLGEFLENPALAAVTNIVPATLSTVSAGLTSMPATIRQVPVFLTSDGRLGVVMPSDPGTVIFAGDKEPFDLRKFAPESTEPSQNLRIRAVRSNSFIESCDLNRDGVIDLIVVLGLSLNEDLGEEGESIMLLLLGKPQPQANEFPYSLPDAKDTVKSLTHGNVSSIAIGDFAPTLGVNYLEIAVALPVGGSLGNEVRFYRWNPTAQRFQHSFTSTNHHALPVGDEPNRILAGDFNVDGRVDIAVSSRKDDNLWIFYNFSSPSMNVDVDLTRFQGAPANPLALPKGMPKSMLGGDINGDGVPDVVVVIESSVGAAKEQTVAFYLSPGSLGGTGLRIVPDERTGNHVLVGGSWLTRDAVVHTRLGDLNGDGAPDLVLGWNTSGVDDYNLRVLFANNF